MGVSKKTPELIDALVNLLHDGLSYTQACAAVNISRRTVNQWRSDDPALDEKLRNANCTGVTILNDDVLHRYQAVIDGRNEWNKEQVAAMRDYSQHIRWLSSRLFPKMYGEKGQAVVNGQGGGPITLTWMSTGKDEAVATEDPLLIEGTAETVK